MSTDNTTNGVSSASCGITVSGATMMRLQAAWYLGGNHADTLVASVDGDLDSNLLSQLKTVPKAIGELAFSVESLVSDDMTSGGFEADVLERIAANTVIPNAAPTVTTTTKKVPRKALPSSPSSTSSATKRKKTSSAKNSPAFTPATTSTPTPPLTTKFMTSVPDPLAGLKYDPVPNPLAEVTPPASPTLPQESFTDQERKLTSPPMTKKVRRVISVDMVPIMDETAN